MDLNKEAISKSAINFSNNKDIWTGISRLDVRVGFETGAYSDSAKEFWFNSKEFQAEKIKAQIEVLKELSEAENKLNASLIIILEDLQKQLNELE